MIEDIRMPEGATLRVDREGAVEHDDSQTRGAWSGEPEEHGMAGKGIAVPGVYPTAASAAARDVRQGTGQPPSQARGLATMMRGVTAVGEAILIALAVPIIILAVGSPIALLARLVLEIARAL